MAISITLTFPRFDGGQVSDTPLLEADFSRRKAKDGLLARVDIQAR